MHFWSQLFQLFPCLRFKHFIYLPRTFLPNRVFRPLPTVFYLLIIYFTYLTYNYIFLMWDKISYLRDLWVLFSFDFKLIILITWLFWKNLILLASKFPKNNSSLLLSVPVTSEDETSSQMKSSAFYVKPRPFRLCMNSWKV